MKILSSIRGSASGLAGQAIQGHFVQKAAHKWGIFNRPRDKKDNSSKDKKTDAPKDKKAEALKDTTPRKHLLVASHVEHVTITKGATISSAPQENGAFLSYDKVQSPCTVMLRLICDGSETGNIGENMLPGFVRSFMDDGVDNVTQHFMDELDKMVADTALYSVATPERDYNQVNIIKYSVNIGADIPPNFRVVEVTLQEVRNVETKGSLEGRTPQGAPKYINGTVQATPVSGNSTKGAS